MSTPLTQGFSKGSGVSVLQVSSPKFGSGYGVRGSAVSPDTGRDGEVQVARGHLLPRLVRHVTRHCQLQK